MTSNPELDTFIFEITEACPLSCRGCFIPTSPLEISVKSVKQIVHNLPPVETFILSGGEPLMHTHLDDILDLLNCVNIYPNIFTSGCISKEKLPYIKDKISSLSVSLKYNSDIMDSKWRGLPDSNTKTMEFIRYARKLDIPIYLHNVVDKLNFNQIDGIKYLGDKYDLNIIFLPFIAYDKKDKDLMLKQNQLNRLKTYCKINNVQLEMEEEYCQAGFKRLCCDVRGNLRGCLYLNHRFNGGNILQDDFITVWEKLQDWRINQGDKIRCPALQVSDRL